MMLKCCRLSAMPSNSCPGGKWILGDQKIFSHMMLAQTLGSEGWNGLSPGGPSFIEKNKSCGKKQISLSIQHPLQGKEKIVPGPHPRRSQLGVINPRLSCRVGSCSSIHIIFSLTSNFTHC